MVGAVRRNVQLDFLFLVTYSASLALACLLVGRAATESGLLSEEAKNVSTTFAVTALAAGTLDAIENVVLLGMLDEEQQQRRITARRTRALFGVALSKFVLVAGTASWIVATPAACAIVVMSRAL